MNTTCTFDVPLPIAAQAAAKSEGQIRRLVMTRVLAAQKQGRHWFVSRQSLDRLLEREGRVPVAADALTPAA